MSSYCANCGVHCSILAIRQVGYLSVFLEQFVGKKWMTACIMWAIGFIVRILQYLDTLIVDGALFL